MRMNKAFVFFVLGMVVFAAGCGGKGQQEQEPETVDVESEINTSALNESDSGIDTSVIEEGINESEDILSDW